MSGQEQQGEALKTAPQQGQDPGAGSSQAKQKEETTTFRFDNPTDARGSGASGSSAAPAHPNVSPDWSPVVQGLVRGNHATPGVGAALHESQMNVSLLWTKVADIESKTREAVLKARTADTFVVEAVADVRRDIQALSMDVKDSITRVVGVEASLGAQTSELAQIRDDIVALKKTCGSAQPRLTGTPAPAPVPPVVGGGRGVKPEPQSQPAQSSKAQDAQRTTNPWTTEPVPPDDFYSCESNQASANPFTRNQAQARPQTAGPSASAHPHAEEADVKPTPAQLAGRDSIFCPSYFGEQVPKDASSQLFPAVHQHGMMGPAYPNLAPVETLVVGFSEAVNYRTYRLRNLSPIATDYELTNMVKLKKKVIAHDSRVEHFDGSDPMYLLTFLSTLRDIYNDLSFTEGMAVRLLASLLDKDSTALEVYTTQITAASAQRIGSFSPSSTWPHVVNALIRHYLSDDVLQKASDAVTMARQLENESEHTFSMRVQALARVCRSAFTEHQIVSYFIRGLRTSVRSRVQNMIRTLTLADRTNIHVVTQMAENEGRSQRAQAEASTTPRSSRADRGATDRSSINPTFLLGGSSSAPFSHQDDATSTTESSVHELDLTSPAPHLQDPAAIVDTAFQLHHLFFLTSEQVHAATEGLRQEGRDVTGPTESIPDLTPEQIKLAYAVIPQDYWQLNCWTCREDGHNTFTCKFLTEPQRMYFAYKYYLHQVQANSRMKEWYAQKMRAYYNQGPDPGPRPRNDGFRGGRGGGGGMGYGRGGYGRGGGRPPRPRYDQSTQQPQPIAPSQPTPTASVQVLTREGDNHAHSSSSSENE